MIEQALALEFGRAGNAGNYLGDGWSDGEDGFRWMVGASSDLWLEHSAGTADGILELDLHPFVRSPELPAQRLALAVRGVTIGQLQLSSGGVLGWRVPPALLAGPGPVRVTLHHPDARRPNELSETSDNRPLAISVRTARLLRLAASREPPARVSAPARGPRCAPASCAVGRRARA